MGMFGWWQWVIVLVIVLLLFGRGKIPDLMGDVAKGIKNFRKGLADDAPDEKADSAKTVEHKSEEGVDTTTAAKKQS
ncbi:twin-arginine translocase TatA/TatE family subunit [Oricola sp.]|uniref:twin-arginine translocase TatA/TatE family subunit n=1 Tax=Oricola sp. TaxID=1979950 RepID=UPI0025FFF195|nr:twin-arginine translocase TatA/TatE family subunit [Oricola sp.]MCI5073791.1 twin-arginine translocase TatA/TatE family subunit [Oricola sp.]